MEQIHSWLEQFHAWGLVIQVFAIVFGVLLANFLQRRFIKKLHAKLEATRNPWDDALVDAISKPLSMMFWVLGIAFAIEVIQSESLVPTELFQAVGPIRSVAVIAIIAWFLLRVIQRAEQNIIDERERVGKPIDKTTLDALAKLVKISVIITAALMVLQTLGFSISGVLAFGGIGGVAVGFAAKDLLANFFGALMIYLDRPFAVGDWVRSPDKEIEGTVEHIGWRQTRIRTFDKRPLYVPNGIFANIAVENPSRMTNRRIKETFGVRYEDINKMDAIVAEVKQMLLAHEHIDNNQTLIVNFDAFNASSVDFFIYTFTKTINWIEYHEIKQDVLLKVAAIVNKHEAEFAFPTRTLHVANPIHVANASV